MEMRQHQSKMPSMNLKHNGEKATLPNNLFFDNNVPHVNVILVNQNKKNKSRSMMDPNELLMEFHCEV